MLSPDKSTRVTFFAFKAEIRREFFHWGKASPLYSIIPDGAIDGTQYLIGCSIPSISVKGEMTAPE